MPAGGLRMGLVGNSDEWFPGGLAPGPYQLETKAGTRIRQNVTNVSTEPTDRSMMVQPAGSSVIASCSF